VVLVVVDGLRDDAAGALGLERVPARDGVLPALARTTLQAMSLEVTSRLKELAVRMALGARSTEVFGLVIRHGAMVAGAGLLAGLAGALALTRLLGSLLFEVTPTDGVTFATVTLVLGVVALLSSLIPARRASRVDPIISLRQD
jgi:putative ABC transport system permease protein